MLPAEESTADLEQQIASLIAEPAVARAHWGVAVATMDGRPLLQLDVDKLFHPASNAKLFTTVAAMALLGPDVTVTTRVEARGPVRDGVLSGDLALVGEGDAEFATDDVPYRSPTEQRRLGLVQPASGTPPAEAQGSTEPHPLHALEAMAEAVVAAGVRTITGDVVGDDTFLVWEPYPEDWANDDLLWGYGAPVNALAIHDNQMALHIRPGATVGAPAQAVFEPGMPSWFALDSSGLRTAATKTGTHVEVGHVPGRLRALRVWGAIAVDAPEDTEQIAIEEPALLAAETLRAMLAARGVAVNGAARAEHRLPRATRSLREQVGEPLGPAACENCVLMEVEPLTARTLATATSPTLLADETVTNKLSQNLHAELLLERLGARFGVQTPAASPLEAGQTATAVDAGSRAQGVRVMRSIFPGAGIDPDDVVLVDGSGLSTHDLVTPRALVRLLTWAAAQPWFAGWRATLPIGGVDGSLSGRFTKLPLTAHVFAKTGTLGEARALSGYLECASGRTVAFSILVDNHTPASTADREIMDRIVAAIYRAE